MSVGELTSSVCQEVLEAIMESSCKDVLSSYVQVKVSDGRMLVGLLDCMDGQGNCVMTSCTEFYKHEEDEEESCSLRQRMVPNVSIAAKYIVGMSVRKSYLRKIFGQIGVEEASFQQLLLSSSSTSTKTN
eukprot:GHVS01042836.1.p1 GENE.GHVS01042836.1~~GHVS01042836.1.p1  ORF type:complete len:130 (+),score=32.64 GHVS01042836.1:89-478(+)